MGNIDLCDRKGQKLTTCTNLCGHYGQAYITELIAGQYLVELCLECNEIKVVNMVKIEKEKENNENDVDNDSERSDYDSRSCGSEREKEMEEDTEIIIGYSGSSGKLHALCAGPKDGSLLVWDSKGRSVIQLQWNPNTKQLDEILKVLVPIDNVSQICYVPQADLVALISGQIVQAVKLQEGYQPSVWEIQGKVLGKEFCPKGVSSDTEGKVYIADKNKRVLLVNAYTGEVLLERLTKAGLRNLSNLCCLSNPSQILLYDSYWDNLTLYNTAYL